MIKGSKWFFVLDIYKNVAPRYLKISGSHYVSVG